MPIAAGLLLAVAAAGISAAAFAGGPMAARLLEMTEDPDPRVRMQLAFTLGQDEVFDDADRPGRIAALARLARRDGADKWARAAILSSSRGLETDLFQALISEPGGVPAAGFVAELAAIIGAGGDGGDLARMFTALADADPASAESAAAATFRGVRDGFRLKGRWEIPLAAALPALVRLSDRGIAARDAEKFLTDFAPDEFDTGDAAARIRAAGELLDRALNRSAEEAARVGALRDPDIRAGRFSASRIAPLIAPAESEAVQLAALDLIDAQGDAAVAGIILARMEEMSPAVREHATDILFSRSDRVAALAAALEGGSIGAARISPQRRAHLLNYPDAAIRDIAERTLDARAEDGGALMEKYRPSLGMEGHADAGAEIHARRCAQCHRMGEVGFDVGPAWSSIRSNPPEKTLQSILYPSAEIKPDYVDYVIETADGRVLTGIIVSSAPTSVVLRRGGGEEEVVLRSGIRSMRATNLSLMPEGLEDGLSPADMADLFAFMRTAE